MPSNVLETLLLKTPTIPFFSILINMVLAFLLGFLIAFIYRKTYRGYSYSASFLQTLILVTMITAVVIMLIGNNLARAFGLVGAMSIIRFRTALKDTWDMAFIFWALALGLAAGSGNHLIGISGGISIGLVIWQLYRTQFGFMQHRELLLRFWMSVRQGEKPVYLHVFDRHLSQYTMLNVRGTPSSKFVELSFFVRLKKSDQSQQLIHDLSALEGIDRVSLLVGENIPEN
jgi:uncharacterized membrane protein YhiD involved in acid resistance